MAWLKYMRALLSGIATTMRHDGLFVAFAVLLSLAGFVFTIHAGYPGYLDGDSVNQMEQAVTRVYHDWKSPSVALLWSLLMNVLPGPVAFIVFNNILIWCSVAVMALALRRVFGVWSLLFIVIPLSPGVVNYLTNVHVDAMLAAWLLAASCLAYLSNRSDIGGVYRTVLQVFANLFVVAGSLTRLNAIFALIPLLLYANAKLGARRNIVLCLVLLMAMPVLYKSQNALLDIQLSSPEDSIKTYHLLALSYYERKNLFPGRWSPQESKDIVESCYTPVQWDTAAPWGACAFINRELNWQSLWGTSVLTKRWHEEILREPAGLFYMLMPTFKKSMYDPNSRAMLYNSPNRWGWAVQDNPRRMSTVVMQDYVMSKLNDNLARPWLFGVLSAVGVILIFLRKLIYTNEGRFALTLFLSGLLYILTYFFANVSAEFRYFYWAGFSTCTGLVVLLLCLAARLDKTSSTNGIPRGLKFVSFAIALWVVTLIVLPFKMSRVERVVEVESLSDKPVVVTGIYNTATPKWMRKIFEGRVSGNTWVQSENTYKSSTKGAKLISKLDMLHETIGVDLAVGPGMGAVRISTAGTVRVIDTASRQGGTANVVLPPLPTDGSDDRKRADKTVFFALVLFSLLFYMFWKIIPARSHGKAR